LGAGPIKSNAYPEPHRTAMSIKKNPLNLNTLQLKTLTILQAVAELPDAAEPNAQDGSVKITALPHAHGNHVHVGHYMVSGADATGLQNGGVWAALERKGLVSTDFPNSVTLHKVGLDYDTGLRQAILHEGGH
jgi:hypothetical protein